MIFKLYECDIGVKLNGVDYQFRNVVSVTIDDPERVQLTRGSSGNNDTGIAYVEGIREPKRVTIPIIEMSADMAAAFNAAYDNRTRMDVYIVCRSDGSSKWAKLAVLSNRPQQIQLDDTPDSMNVSIEWVSFSLTENHKS